jgi:hypothetical protein
MPIKFLRETITTWKAGNWFETMNLTAMLLMTKNGINYYGDLAG